MTQAQLQLPEVEGKEVVIEEYVPPSELEVAKGVVKDVFAEYIPEEQRPIAAAAGVALFVVIIVLILKLFISSED